MPDLAYLIEDDLFGPVLKQAREERYREGWDKGYRQGPEEGERLVILRMIATRFDPVSE